MQRDWPPLLRLLHEELSYNVREGSPTLGYELFFVDLSSWKLRLSNRTPVIWVKTKDLENVPSQHVIQSLGDVVRERNLSRQITLILVDGNSQPLFRHKSSLEYNLVLIGAEEQKNIAQSRRPSGELHVHLVLEPSERRGSLAESMKGIKLSYAQYYKGRYKHIGHFWLDRYKSIIIAKDDYLLACGSYVELNPVRAKIVDDLKIIYGAVIMSTHMGRRIQLYKSIQSMKSCQRMKLNEEGSTGSL